MVGQCASHIEAQVLKRALEDKGVVSGKIVEQPGDPGYPATDLRQGFVTEDLTTRSSVFSFPADYYRGAAPPASQLKSEAVQFEVRSRQLSPEIDQMRRLSDDKKVTQALELLEASFARIPQESRAYASMELGRLRALAKRPQDSIIAAYRPVADGTLTVPRESRERAAAAIAHALRYGTNGKGRNVRKSLDSYQAFRELAVNAANPSIRAQAAVECVALSLENVKEKKGGQWDDVRAEAERARLSVPSENRRALATIALMETESYYYAGRMQDAISAAEGLMAGFGDQKRELRMARITAALAYQRLGNSQRATELLQENVVEAANPRKGEAFGDLVTGKVWDVRNMSIQWLVVLSQKDGDRAAQEHWLSVLASDYPGTAEKLDVEAMLKNLRSGGAAR